VLNIKQLFLRITITLNIRQTEISQAYSHLYVSFAQAVGNPVENSAATRKTPSEKSVGNARKTVEKLREKSPFNAEKRF